jgi:hypothetical protein
LELFIFDPYFCPSFELFDKYFDNCSSLDLFLLLFSTQEIIFDYGLWSLFNQVESVNYLGSHNAAPKFVPIHCQQYF